MTVRKGETTVRVDLGCGTAKCPGFIGADRLPLNGVDVILDLDAMLPFRSDSVDVLVMNHSLEHARDLLATLREVYRVCRHGAQVCIVAPYSHQALNLANPFHHQTFNEHTPRFWTDSPHSPLDPSDYSHPHAPAWGLSRSDHGDPGIDFRCVSMEFFYFPEYRNLPVHEQRAARKRHLDVCDQIVYQLITVKNDPNPPEMHELTQNTPLFEPPHVTARKGQERIALLEADLEALRAAVCLERAQAEKSVALLEADLEALRAAVCLERAQAEKALADLSAVREDLGHAHRRLAEANGRLAEVGLLLDGAREETRIAHHAREEAVREVGHAGERAERRAVRWQHHARALSAELTALRHGRVTRALRRFWPGPDLTSHVGPAFRDLLDDSYLFLGDLRGYRLQPSDDLQIGGCLTYALTVHRPHLSGLMLAPIVDLPDDNGSIATELSTPSGSLLATNRISLSEIELDRPVAFAFLPVSHIGPAVLRVELRGTATPVRLFEWRKSRFLGMGGRATRPFCALKFEQRGVSAG